MVLDLPGWCFLTHLLFYPLCGGGLDLPFAHVVVLDLPFIFCWPQV